MKDIYSQEAEEAVLGAILLDPSKYHSVRTILTGDDFFIVRHRTIFAAMAGVIESSTPLDYLVLVNALKDQGQLDEIGGGAYITQLVNNTPRDDHAEVYAELVKRAALRRNLAQVARKVFTLASDETRPYEEIETEALATIESAQRQDGYTTVSLKAALNGVLDALENPVRAAVCPLGFRDLDDLVKPQAEKLILWGGAPGMGKSAMLLCAALNAAKQGKVIFFCTMEMSVSEITQRALAMESGVPYRRLQYEELSGWEMSKVMEAAGRMSNYRLFFDDTAGNRMTPQLLRAKCKRVKGREGRLDAVFVDYIQLMNGKTKTTQTREQEVSEIGKALKNLAKDLRTPIHAVAALNRSLSDRKDKRPQLSDLRESGALEYDADTVIFLYRDVVYNDMSEFPNQADVIVAKNRNGAIGTVSLYFEKTLTKFMDGQARQVDFNNVNWTSDETEANYVH